MDWTSIPEDEVLGLINEAYRRMNPIQRAFWEQIAICPEKWKQHPYGDRGGGFWVAAIMGRKIIWYNDIEEGWNVSLYKGYGRFENYACAQDDLGWILEEFRNNHSRGSAT